MKNIHTNTISDGEKRKKVVMNCAWYSMLWVILSLSKIFLCRGYARFVSNAAWITSPHGLEQVEHDISMIGNEEKFASRNLSTRQHLDSWERSFVAVKPDGVTRGLIGEIITRLERKGLRLTAIKLLQPTVEQAKQHYSIHEGKSFFDRLIDFFTSGPVVAMVWEGPRAITLIRKLAGDTHPETAVPGTIRGDFAFERGKNIVHSSDSVESAEREIFVWFQQNELQLSEYWY